MREAIETARSHPISYKIRMVTAPNGRLLVVLGEAHLKLPHAHRIGNDLVDAFGLRGVESFQKADIFAGRLTAFLVHFFYKALRVFSLGLIKGSTITAAIKSPRGRTIQIERSEHTPLPLHIASVYLAAVFLYIYLRYGILLLNYWHAIPQSAYAMYNRFLTLSSYFNYFTYALIPAYFLRHQPWGWLIHPLIAILSVRDQLMVAGTVRMLADFPDAEPALVIMGRAHLAGYIRELTKKHQFTEVVI
jgi:hypothetical protein